MKASLVKKNKYLDFMAKYYFDDSQITPKNKN